MQEVEIELTFEGKMASSQPSKNQANLVCMGAEGELSWNERNPRASIEPKIRGGASGYLGISESVCVCIFLWQNTSHSF